MIEIILFLLLRNFGLMDNELEESSLYYLLEIYAQLWKTVNLSTSTIKSKEMTGRYTVKYSYTSNDSIDSQCSFLLWRHL